MSRADHWADQGFAVGIDRGITYSCVVFRGNRIEIMPSECRDYTSPSCVAFTEVRRFIGPEAQKEKTPTLPTLSWMSKDSLASDMETRKCKLRNGVFSGVPRPTFRIEYYPSYPPI